MEHGRIKGLALAFSASQLAIVDQVRHRSVACRVLKKSTKVFASLRQLKGNIPAPPYFSFAAMKQQDLSPNLMLILWLVIVPAAVMGAAIAGGDAKIFAESEGPTG